MAEELRLLLPVLYIMSCTLGGAPCCCIIQGAANALAAAGFVARAGGTMPMVIGIIPGMVMADGIPGIIPGIIGGVALPLPRVGGIMGMAIPGMVM